jgi:putative ABC transport system permease protein
MRPTRPARLARALVDALAIVVPGDERDTWRREWQAELAYALPRQATGAGRPLRWLVVRLAAAARHAIWLRWQTVGVGLLWQDVRQARRALLHRPVFALTAVSTLALGIGATSLMYGAVRAVLLKPLPFPESDRIVLVSSTTSAAPDAINFDSVSPPDFVDWRRLAHVFDGMASINEGSFTLGGVGVAEQVRGAAVSGAFFEVLGVRAESGRTLTLADADDGRPDVAVISDGLWHRRFGRDPRAIGRRIALDGMSREIVGVMPRGFGYPLAVEVWITQRFTAQDLLTQRGAHYLTVIGRLRPGTSLMTATADMRTVADRLAETYPRTNQGGLTSVQPLRRALVADVQLGMQLLFGAVGLVFLLACANVASLTLGAALGRARDAAVRLALGASRMRLIRASLVEGAVLAGAGGLAGAALAAAGARVVAARPVAGVPLLDATRLDANVGLFIAFISGAALLFVSLIPAWQASREDITGGLRLAGARTTTDRRRRQTRSALVVSEIALAAALLIGAGVVAQSFLRLTRVDLGFDPARVQTFSLSLPETRFREQERRALFVDDLLERIRARADVEAAGTTSGLPLTGFNYYISGFERDGARLPPADAARLTMQVRVVSPDYFQAMRIAVRSGRTFAPADRRGTPPVVVLNERAARVVWPSLDPIGRSFVIGTRLGLGGDRVGGTTIGIVGDVHDDGPSQPPRPMMYVSYAQFPIDSLSVVVKTRGDPAAVSEPLRALVAGMDPDVPVFRMRTMADLASDAVAQTRLSLQLLAVFATAAVALAVLGIYGVIAQNVGSRRREIGIRIALGADRGRVVTMIISQAGRMVLAGVAIGMAIALAGGRRASTLLFGLDVANGATLAAVAGLLLVVALAAAWLPARRAARVDPVTALRAE